MKHRLAALMLCLVLTLCCAFNALAGSALDPIVVQVGAVGYPLSMVQAYWENYASGYLAMGETIDSTQIDWYEDSIVDTYVKMGVLENKLMEFGLDKITPEDEQQIEADAQARYDAELELYVKQIMQQYGRTAEQARAYAQTFMDLDGITMAQARELALAAFKEKRILDYATSDVTEPTDEEVQAYYNENLVEPSREHYEFDIQAFETDIVYYGAVSYYIPLGYRYVRHILLPASEGSLARANAQEAVVLKAEETVTIAENALYGIRVLNEDETAATLTLSEAQAALQKEQAALQAIYDENLARYAVQIKDITDRLAAGESFDSVSASYEKDAAMPETGYLVSADSVIWAKNFKTAALALQPIGAVSEPVCTNAGIHFIQYAADAPQGAVPLTGELFTTVKAAALLQRRYDILTGLVDTWREEYPITTQVGLLSVPECLK